MAAGLDCRLSFGPSSARAATIEPIFRCRLQDIQSGVSFRRAEGKRLDLPGPIWPRLGLVPDAVQADSIGQIQQDRHQVPAEDAAEAAPDRGQCLPLRFVPLAPVLGEFDGAVSLDDPGEEAARPYSGKLVRIADEDRLSPRLLNLREHRREDAGLGHPGFVDKNDAAARKAGLGGLVEMPVERSGANPGLVLELLRGHSGGRSAEDGDSSGGECLRYGARRSRLPSSRNADNAHDAVAAAGDRHQHGLLIGR